MNGGWRRSAAGCARSAARCRTETAEHLARTDARLVRLPERGVEQGGVVAHEDVTHGVVAEQERCEGLREHVARAHAVPDFAAHCVLLAARRGRAAKVAVGEVFDIVVVVEHHLAAARDAKVLPERVAGDDVGGHQVFDGVAVVDDAALHLLVGARLRRAVITALQRNVLHHRLQLACKVARVGS